MTAQFPPYSEHPSISPLHSNLSGVPLDILQKIVRHAVELLDLEDCAVGLVDGRGTDLVFVAYSQEEAAAEYTPVPLHTSLVASVGERCASLILDQTRVDARLQPLSAGSTRTLACLPLLDGSQLLGMLLASAATSRAFASTPLRLLSLLADQAALALLNARQAERVRDAGRMKTNFLSLVTHELRSPLNAINGYLDLTLEGLAGELNEQQREFLQRARAGSEHLYALVEDLLLASRADAGQLRLTRESTVLQTLVNAALEELELTARDAGVILAADIPADFPTLFVDAVRLQQVLRNLLNNALRFTPAGGRVTLTARLLPAKQGGQQKTAEIHVRDTGCGIAQQYHERIFERFFQVPRLEGGRASGQGLGLAIIKMIVELHGGHVWVESVPGEGSVFIFTLEVPPE